MRDRLTVQIAPDLHLAATGDAWAMSNHACRPNCRIDFAHWALVTSRPVAAGEELTWHYLTTEWELAAPCRCGCGASDCLGQIKGFRHLPGEAQGALLAAVSPAVRELHGRHAARSSAARRPGRAHRHLVA